MNIELKIINSRSIMAKHWASLIFAFILTMALFILGRTELAIGLVKAPYDLLLHAVFFGFLALLIWFGCAYKIGLTFFMVSALTIMDELSQLGLPGRVGSEKDVLAGMTGALIILTVLNLIKKSKRKESM